MRINEVERDNPEIGSQFVFVAMDSGTKLVLAHEVGKRTPETTTRFMLQLADRIVGRPKIVTDGFQPYVEAVAAAFGRRVDFAQLVKTFVGDGHPVQEGYAPARRVLRCDPLIQQGYIDPWEISTSLVERQNGTLRHFAKRLCRLTYAFSKKLENLRAAIALHFCWYNFGRQHGTLGMTQAMAAGIERRFWKVGDLLPAW